MTHPDASAEIAMIFFFVLIFQEYATNKETRRFEMGSDRKTGIVAHMALYCDFVSGTLDFTEYGNCEKV